MRLLLKLVRRFATEDKAAEVTELAIVLVFIVAGAIALIATLGGTVQSGYTAVNTNL